MTDVVNHGTRDHPRIRGEHFRVLRPEGVLIGSSPHTRGAPRSAPEAWARVRIIPAYAGSTPAPPAPAWTATDHPRIRGEHRPAQATRPLSQGSSPHTRGAHVTTSALSAWIGIIPAYAGSTLASSRDSPASRDHPRIRGEHPPRWVQPDAYRGSSPHTRGARRYRCGRC